MSPIRLAASTLAVAALLAAACSPTPSASPSATAERTFVPTATPVGSPPASSPAAGDGAVYAAIRDQVTSIRGLQPTAVVEPVTIDEKQLFENLEAEIDAELTPEILSVSNDLLTTLGLIPQGSSLRDLTLDLLAGQVAGYYSPDRDELFVVSRTGETVGPVERTTYAHEYTHQLQDQNFDLATFDTTSIDQSDRALAQTALIEGDATLVQTLWIFQANLTPDEIGEILAAGQDPEALAALENAPLYLRDTGLFPYEGGLILAQQLTLSGEGALDAAFADPPVSTEQIIHPEKYIQREDPVEVRIADDLPARVGSGWTEIGRDTLGELILRVWLEEHGVGKPRGALLDPPSQILQDAVAGWGGDRLVLLRHDDGSLAVALSTTWDTAGEAAEFAAAAETALADTDLEGRLFHRAGTNDVLLAIGDSSADVLAALRA
jgi:hypothetical protein